MSDHNHLRDQCRSIRKSLKPSQHIAHSRLATLRFLKRFCLDSNQQKIAVFLSFDEEISTQRIIAELRKKGHQLYLPKLSRTTFDLRKGPMIFVPYFQHSMLYKNRFAINEPFNESKKIMDAKKLDSILMPLTCFDEKKNRVGMGGGFYDRALAYKAISQSLPPKLIGWAHSCQKVTHIPTRPWDISMDYLVSEQFIK